MYTSIAILLVTTQLSTQQPTDPPHAHPWSFTEPIKNFFEEKTQSVADFFETQKNKVENMYDDAFKVKDSVDEYVEYVGNQQKKISNEINNYVQESGRKIEDTVSFLPENRVISEEDKLDNPDVVLTVPAIARRNRYPCETHTVISQGYVLNLHRIPTTKNVNKPPNNVILHHGLFASSADWILNGPGKALAYVLADAGYDVWMPNMRGNKYSREHLSLKTDTKIYWNFSWHEVAVHDVPAIIDYIKTLKGEGSKIAYIGHSMGTAILFAMLSSRPEYNEKLVAGFALAPIAFMSDVKGPTKSLAPLASNVAYMEMVYGSHEFLPKNSAIGRITDSCTNKNNIDETVCKNTVFSICGYNERQFNKTLLPVFLSHLGTGTSWKTVVHFAQEIEAGGKFQKFDYGARYNKKLYGTDTPPEYDLSKISLPINLFWAQNDLLSSEKDVRNLYEKLPVGSELFMIPDRYFNHLDYLWAVDAPTLLNGKVLERLEKRFGDHRAIFTIW